MAVENDKELEEIMEQRAVAKTEETKPLIDFEKTEQKQQVEEQDENTTKTLVKQGVEAAIMHKLKNDDKVQEKFLEAADKVVDTNLSEVENQAEADEKAAILKNNKDACDLYGIDEKTVPKWVVKCAKRVQDFWYAMWLIVGFFTTVPIVFLGKKIKVVLKRTWISMTLAAIIYVAIVTAPLWRQWLS